MKVIYLETSVLLSVLFRESDFERSAEIIESADRIATSSLTFIECRRAISRLVATQHLKEGKAKSLEGKLVKIEQSWDILKITEEIEARAGAPFPKEPLRTLDAIHLASALEFTVIYPTIKILSNDRRILDNLEPLGLEAY